MKTLHIKTVLNKISLVPLLISLAFLFVILPNFAAAKTLDISQFTQNHVSLTEYFDVLEDSTTILTLADVKSFEIASRFKTDIAPSTSLNFGYTSSAYWLRLSLENKSDQPIERILELAYHPLAHVDFYQPYENGYQVLQTGYAVPFLQRPYQFRFFVLPVSIPAHSEQAIYLRIETPNCVIIPARLWEKNAFLTYERRDNSIQALYLGMAISMVLYNVFLLSTLRDTSYLLYVLFSSTNVLSMIFYAGTSNELFSWSDTFAITRIGTSVTSAWSFTFFLLFMRQMLNTATVLPKLDFAVRLFIGINVLFPFLLLAMFEEFIKYRAFEIIMTSVLILIVGLICSFKRQRSAYFFTVAFTLFFAIVITVALEALAILPTNVTNSTWQLEFGSAVEMLLLAFALADRYNVIRKEKEQAQQLLVETLKSSEQILESCVAERTRELQIANAKLQALSMTDGLTGIANRRRFDDVLESEWNRAERLGQPLALGLLDVDWFKNYNDYYGHQMGDECLKKVAQVLVANISRTTDLVARYGGEEFVFIAPSTNAQTALSMAKKVCDALEMLTLPHEVSAYKRVTISIGVAAVIPRKDLNPEMLVENADIALYQAKKWGRNQAVLADMK